MLVDFGSFHSHVDNVINDSLTILSLDTDETVRNLNIKFSIARLFMFLLIFNEQRVLKFTFVLVLTYHVNHSLEGAPHLFVILTAIG